MFGPATYILAHQLLQIIFAPAGCGKWISAPCSLTLISPRGRKDVGMKPFFYAGCGTTNGGVALEISFFRTLPGLGAKAGCLHAAVRMNRARNQTFIARDGAIKCDFSLVLIA
jgi:hypothetical protein